MSSLRILRDGKNMAGKQSLGLVLGVGVVALAVGAGAAWFISQGARASAKPVAPATAKSGQIVHLEGFTVNLADPEASHFLRVTMDLEVEHMPQSPNKEKPEAGLPTAKIRDAIVSVLTVSKADVLLTSEGKAQLKKNLLDALKSSVPELGVSNIYFTEFLVQR
jgi:flagellar basal body-associated protein FliL